MSTDTDASEAKSSIVSVFPHELIAEVIRHDTDHPSLLGKTATMRRLSELRTTCKAFNVVVTESFGGALSPFAWVSLRSIDPTTPVTVVEERRWRRATSLIIDATFDQPKPRGQRPKSYMDNFDLTRLPPSACPARFTEMYILLSDTRSLEVLEKWTKEEKGFPKLERSYFDFRFWKEGGGLPLMRETGQRLKSFWQLSSSLEEVGICNLSDERVFHLRDTAPSGVRYVTTLKPYPRISWGPSAQLRQWLQTYGRDQQSAYTIVLDVSKYHMEWQRVSDDITQSMTTFCQRENVPSTKENGEPRFQCVSHWWRFEDYPQFIDRFEERAAKEKGKGKGNGKGEGELTSQPGSST